MLHWRHPIEQRTMRRAADTEVASALDAARVQSREYRLIQLHRVQSSRAHRAVPRHSTSGGGTSVEASEDRLSPSIIPNGR
jgi:hypothetical protein